MAAIPTAAFDVSADRRCGAAGLGRHSGQMRTTLARPITVGESVEN